MKPYLIYNQDTNRKTFQTQRRHIANSEYCFVKLSLLQNLIACLMFSNQNKHMLKFETKS